jgi:catalase
MPLPSDERIIHLAEELLKAFDALSGVHPGYRPAHAKGILLEGVFYPRPEAASLTRAPHLRHESTPVTARFSNGTGFPMVPDNDPTANPRGLAVRFNLGDHIHTDIISHSADGFPARTGEEFLGLLRAVASGNGPAYVAGHPAALAFEQIPKPSPASFATEAYFAVTAFRFSNANGLERFGRYRLTPEAGVEHLSPAAAKSKDANYLIEDITRRLSSAPIRFDLRVQLAQDGDIVNDSTFHWPADRPLISLGTLVLSKLAPDDEAHQRIIFDPIPRVEGIEASDDPLFELRAAIYLLSGRRRRQAIEKPAPVPRK